MFRRGSFRCFVNLFTTTIFGVCKPRNSQKIIFLVILFTIEFKHTN